MTLTRGERLGRFEIVGHLGSGGMGEVYRAFDPELEREVAIKVLPEELAREPQRLVRFEREARAIGRLQHPHLLAIHDLGRHQGVPYLVFELLEGETLKERLDRGPLAVGEALDLAAQIAEGLAAAHAEGVVHRDLKPANLFVSEEGRLKILDFGLAKATTRSDDEETEEPTRTALTEAGLVLGTAAYMAPEQAAGRPVDHRADQFALGVVLYEMLAGRRPFAGTTAPEILSAILRDDPEPLADVAPEVPAPVRWLVERCLERDPRARWESTRDLVLDLANLRQRLTELPRGAEGAESERRAGARGGSSRVLPWALVALLTLLATAAGIGLLLRGDPEPATIDYRQITFRRGTVTEARFDPTSDAVIYSASWDGGPERLHLYRPQDVDPLVVGPADSRLVAVSSDGELLLLRDLYPAGPFFGAGDLARMPLTGAPRDLAADVAAAVFGADGEIAAVVREERGLAVLEFPAGTPRLTTGGILIDPRLSPDGRRLAVAHGPQRGHEWGPIVVLDRDGGERRLAEEAGLGLAWSASGEEIWYVAKDGLNRLDAVSPEGRTRTVASFPTPILLFDVAADGRVLLATQQRRYEMAGRSRGSEERDLTWLAWSVPFDLSADGSTLLFNECSGFAMECRAALRGFEDETPVVLDRSAFAIHLSRDGEWAVSIPPWNPTEVVLIATGSEERRRLDAEGLERMELAVWSPVDDRLYLSGHRPGEGTRVFRLEPEGGVPTPVTPEGIAFGFFALSPDGRTVAAPRIEGTIALYPLDGGEPTILERPEQPIRWSEDGRSLYTFRLGVAPTTLHRIDLVTGRAEEVATLMPGDAAGVVQVSPVSVTGDGTTWVYGYLRQLTQLFVVSGLE